MLSHMATDRSFAEKCLNSTEQAQVNNTATDKNRSVPPSEVVYTLWRNGKAALGRAECLCTQMLFDKGLPSCWGKLLIHTRNQRFFTNSYLK